MYCAHEEAAKRCGRSAITLHPVKGFLCERYDPDLPHFDVLPLPTGGFGVFRFTKEKRALEFHFVQKETALCYAAQRQLEMTARKREAFVIIR